MRFVDLPGTTSRLSIWETRRGDFRAFVRDTNYDAKAGVKSMSRQDFIEQGDYWADMGYPETDEHPAGALSWEDAMEFCAWLTREERELGHIEPNQFYRLPKDHEWSIAIGIADQENPEFSARVKDRGIPDLYLWGTDYPPPPDAGNFKRMESRIGSEPHRHEWRELGYRDEHPRATTRIAPPPSPPNQTKGIRFEIVGTVPSDILFVSGSPSTVGIDSYVVDPLDKRADTMPAELGRMVTSLSRHSRITPSTAGSKCLTMSEGSSTTLVSLLCFRWSSATSLESLTRLPVNIS